MKKEDKPFNDLAQRVEDIFPEFDSDIVTNLLQTNEVYSKLYREANKLQKEYPMIGEISDDCGEITLSAEERAAIVQHRNLKLQMEGMERMQIYLRGHADCFVYMKKIGAI